MQQPIQDSIPKLPNEIDNSTQMLYTAKQVEAIAECAAMQALQKLLLLNFDNDILESMPREGENKVARLKERVQLDNGVVKWASGNNKQELFRCIANVLTIQDFYNWMAEAGSHGRKNDLNKHTIDRVSGFLSRILKIAAEVGLIDKSPVNRDLLKNNGKKASNHKPLHKADIIKVRSGIPKLKLERQRLFVALLAYTGMRPEEILGLRWECVDLENGICHMIRTVTYPDKKRAVVQEGGKTELSVRQINLVPDVVAVLRQVENKMGYVVHGKDNMSPCPRTTYVKTYTAAFRQLGIDGYVPYDFRTNFATECCEQGFTAKQTADMMGHADTRMVEKVYAKRRSEGVIQYREELSRMMACDKDCDTKKAV